MRPRFFKLRSIRENGLVLARLLHDQPALKRRTGIKELKKIEIGHFSNPGTRHDGKT